MAHAMGMGVTAWSPLASGLLTGKYAGGAATEDMRLGSAQAAAFRIVDERHKKIAEAVVSLAKELGRTPAQVALNWVRQQPGVVIPIIGARRLDQVKDNMACLEFALTGEQMGRLDEASKIEMGFPHDFFAKPPVRGFVYGGLDEQIDGPR